METSSVDELREVNVASPLTGRCHDLLLIAQRRSPVFHLLPGTPRTIRSQGLKRADALATAEEANSQKHDTQKKERQFKDFSLYKPTLNDNIKRDQKGRY